VRRELKDHYVNLDRRFDKFSSNTNSEVVAMHSYLTGFAGGEAGSAWDDILKHQLVVVLGEPGSGKSEEFRHQVNVGKQNGKTTFLLELNRLVTEGVSNVLGEAVFSEFSQWKATSSEATFFLDAVDESKLQRVDDFLIALDRLHGVIARQLHRCRFVISSRISAWRPETDRAEVMRRFGLLSPSSGEESVEPILIVTLMPLDRQRVELIALGLGIADPIAFVAAIDEHDAWDFARRPLDVIELYRYWQEHAKLGSLTELMEFSCSNLIKEVERKEKHDPLPIDRAWEGVEMLALASLLTRQVNLRIEDDREITAASAVIIRDVLPPFWPNNQQKAVLDRALFDAASYGMLRFHHRRHSEYLAAKCLLRFLSNNCPYTEIEEILFAQVGGLWTIRPSLESVAAWLAGKAEIPAIKQLRLRILEVAPDIHLRYGDPSVLPLPYRKSILKALADRYKGRNRIYITWDSDALKRLASPDLSWDVSAYLTSSETPEDLKCDLLMLVAHGHLSDCCAVAITALSETATSENLRRYAAVAIRDSGTPPIRRQAYDALIAMSNPSSSLIGKIIEACFPSVISTEELLAAIRKSPEIRRNSMDLPYVLEKHFERVLTYDNSVSILIGVLILLREPPLIEEKSVSRRYAWTVELIPLCLQLILRKSTLSSEVVEIIVEAVRVLESRNAYGWWNSHDNRKEAKDISTALDLHPNAKCSLYWRRVNRHREKYGGDPYFNSLHGNYLVAIFSAADLEWMKIDLLGQDRNKADRLLLLGHMLTIAHQDQAVWKLCPRDLPSLLGFDIGLWKFVAKRLIEMAWSPILRFMHHQRHSGVADKYWWTSKKREALSKWNLIRDRYWLWHHQSELASGKFVPTIANIVMDSCKHQSSREVIDWDVIAKKWGASISHSIRLGSETVWRQHKPVFPYEKIDNSVEYFVLAGLPGLASLWERSELDFNAMTADEVDLAVRYACRELNGFPEWFPQLLAQRPNEVGKALMLAIAGEWGYPTDQQSVYGVLSTLIWQDIDMQTIVPGVIGLLKNGDPKNHQILIHALDFVMQSFEGRTMVSVLASERASASVPGSEPWFIWVGAWLRVDAIVALDALEKHVSGLPLPESDALMLGICSNLHGQRGRQISGTMLALHYREPTCLSRLIPLVMQHIRPGEDRDRSNGGVYSPDARDDAQRFRSLLWETLGNSESTEADNVLRDLLGNPVMILERDWIQELLDRRRSKRADDVPWTASDVRNFAEKHLIAPRSDDTLYRLICRHMKDIQASIERTEIPGARKKLRRGDREDSLQNLLHDELIQRAGDWYSVTAESEIDLAQRPDLTISRPGLNSLPIEVKLANLNHWPLHKLLERLENQLIGQYLRAENVRYGVYVLGNVNPKRRWEDVGSGAMIDFQTLVQRITNRARELENENRPGVNGITVIGIDFSDPRERK
jgi:hypothetical protein